MLELSSVEMNDAVADFTDHMMLEKSFRFSLFPRFFM